MQFTFFHLMPYRPLDMAERHKHRAAWVVLPNTLYDPKRGADEYESYINQLVYAEKLGFDVIAVNEHHQTAYGLMPAPNVVAGMLVPQTTGKIAILGNAISLRDHPLRVAEEIAMLDVASGGRIISGFVRGIGSEYHTFGMDPTQSRERFHEAHDLIVRAWTQPGPFEWYGRHFKLRYVNPWPRPLQQPHPPIWSPSQGSAETVDWAARHRYTYLQTFSDTATIRRAFSEFREAAERHGYPAAPEQLGWSVPVYVADTDAEARRAALGHLDFLFNTLLRMPRDMFFPPGYLTAQSAPRVMGAKRGLGTARADPDDLLERGFAIAGSPESVRQQLDRYQRELGFGIFSGVFQFGTVGPEEFERSVRLFAGQVMPALRPAGQAGPAAAAGGSSPR
jgi:alkanesulfonate monooxygenase SsuD/methylene tetrahydromethanopterin reductase-like flavin-dependent oxidoreductase (luciferase family)